jgi:ABC-type sugar transport system ATPase subunit
LIAGEDVTALPPQRRDLAMVFQSYALYPHLRVRDNLGFPLRMHGVPPQEIRERVQRTAVALGIEPLLDRRPGELSGGQRQRVALGRAMVREPRAFLFDEPLSNLDPALRAGTRAELALLHRRLDATMVYVTHDQEEAMTLGTRVAVMRHGAVEQLAPPLAVFERPANAFVARFIGSPQMNLLPGRLSAGARGVRAECGSVSCTIDDDAIRMPSSPDILLGIRPHDMELAPADSADASGSIEIVERLGAATLIHVRIAPATLLRALVPADAPVGVDQIIGLRIRSSRVHVFDRAGEARLN